MRKIIVLSVVLLAAPALACPKGSYEYNGDCAFDIQPEIAKPVQPSDEKPPTDKMPSYQREGVSIVDEPSTSLSDAKADEEKHDAEAQGKEAAGLK